MYLVIDIPPESTGEPLLTQDKHGRTTQVKIPIEFYTRESSGPASYLSVEHKNGDTLDRRIVTVSGRSGQLKLVDRSKGSVEPFLYRAKPKPATPAGASENETEPTEDEE